MTATYTYYTTDVKGNIRESEEVITQVLKWNTVVHVAFVLCNKLTLFLFNFQHFISLSCSDFLHINHAGFGRQLKHVYACSCEGKINFFPPFLFFSCPPPCSAPPSSPPPSSLPPPSAPPPSHTSSCLRKNYPRSRIDSRAPRHRRRRPLTRQSPGHRPPPPRPGCRWTPRS